MLEAKNINVWNSTACVCIHSHNGLPHMSEGLLHKVPHTVHVPGRYDEILRHLLLQHQPHGLKETERQDRDTEVKPLGDHKDSSELRVGRRLAWSRQTGSEPATSRAWGTRPYLCPDVTAGPHGTNTVGKEHRGLPQAQRVAGTHRERTHTARTYARTRATDSIRPL